MWMPEDTFRNVVVEAIDELPETIASWLENVEVIVDDWPSLHQMKNVGVRSRYGLLGLYEGVPQTSRGSSYGLVLPDKITLFRGAILNICQSPADVRTQVTHTLVHELAHHFGIDDERLVALGAY